VKLSNYDKVLPLLDSGGVHYLDTRKMLSETKSASKFPVFSRGGTHWTADSSCNIAGAITEKLNSQLKNKIASIECSNVRISKNNSEEEKDLINLINIWDTSNYSENLPYPDIHPVKGNVSSKPRLLIIGDSFIWGILSVFKDADIIGSSNFLYYFSRIAKYPDFDLEPFEKSSANLNKLIDNADIVIIESSEPALTNIGFGFLESIGNR
jgi:hypothetical protein